ncbi:MAG: zf-HC2 domain-containing protein [Caldilineae bacterium]|nr:zf-HC2 domain-containing protein [Anaerolineae bacterium]MCB9153440.1 zf-HC2 domain-containing protein [Caldilineae bacterium]
MIRDSGTLQAYLDGALAPDEQANVATHLAGCESCRQQVKALRMAEQQARTLLAGLEPAPAAIPAASATLTRLRAGIPAAKDSPSMAVWRRLNDMRETISENGLIKQTPLALRLAAIGALVVVLLAGMMSFAPAREAMAQFLGLFRVQQFTVVNIDDLARMRSFEDVLESGILGEPEMIRDLGEEQPVADQNAAAALAGYAVRLPANTPEGTTLEKLTVTQGPYIRLEVDRPTVQMALDMAEVTDVNLPDFDTAAVEVDAAAVVAAEYVVDNPYGERNAGMVLMQAPSPEIDLPPGIDPTTMGEIYLRAVGLPAADAAHLAQTIDWTSTVVIPMAGDMGSYSEVTADGVPALLFEAASPSRRGRERALLWQRDGIVYGLMAWNVTDSGMLQVADSLR